MRPFERLNRVLGFTPNEGRIVLFLVGTFLVGAALKFFNVSGKSIQQYDYSAVDSEFAARASLSNLPDSGVQNVASDSTRSGSRDQSENHLLNLNTATKDQLINLPGIGEAMAERIILFREEHGGFRKLDDLLKIKGIGAKKFERVAPLLSIGR